jgi:hypothetical protein
VGPGHRKNRDQGFALKLARRVGAARPEARRQILLRGSRICNGPCSSRCITPFEHRLESVGLPLECGFDCGELCLPIREKVPFDARGSQPFHVVRTERDQARRRAGIRRSTATILAVEVDAIGEAQDWRRLPDSSIHRPAAPRRWPAASPATPPSHRAPTRRACRDLLR